MYYYRINKYISEHLDFHTLMLSLPELGTITAAGSARYAIKHRFSKYKSLQRQAGQSSEDKIQRILQILAYQPLCPSSDAQCSMDTTRSSLSAKDDSVGSEEQASIDYELDVSSSDLKLPVHRQSVDVENQAWDEKPVFIRSLAMLNSVIPNTNHPKFNLQSQIKKLVEILKEATKAINYVQAKAMEVAKNNNKVKTFSVTCRHKFTLEYFLNSGWEYNKISESLQPLKPYGNFNCNYDCIEGIIVELDRLMCKTVRYELAIGLTQAIGLELYLRIRENLEEVEQKLIECAASVYLLGSMDQYPDFYYQYLKILTNPQKLSPQYLKQASQQFCRMWEEKEPLSCSEVGRAVWDRLTQGH